MKGKTMVIGIILFVLIVVGAIYFAMMSTINKIKEENNMTLGEVVLVEEMQAHDWIRM